MKIPIDLGGRGGGWVIRFIQSDREAIQACAEKGTVSLSTRLAWPDVAGCSQAETYSQLSSISFAQPCRSGLGVIHYAWSS